jgi:hypothetical protein
VVTGREPVNYATDASFLVASASRIACGSAPTYLVWFDGYASSAADVISDSETDLITRIEKLSDGAIYQIAADLERCAAAAT